MSSLESKIVLITGASSGIGKSAVAQFAKEGAKLILCARRIDRLKELAAEIETETYLIELDLRDRKSVEKVIANLPAEWQAIDILVNNAGLGRGLEKLHEGNIDGWEEMIDTNVKGLLYMSRSIIPGMVTRNSGHIINVGSIAGHEVYPNGNVYCATKHAVDALTKGMRLDLVDTPLRVSTVDPGLVETEFSDVRFYGDFDRARTVYQGYKALEAVDVADTIVWIASRPAHVQVAEVVIFPTDQGSAMVTNKV